MQLRQGRQAGRLLVPVLVAEIVAGQGVSRCEAVAECEMGTMGYRSPANVSKQLSWTASMPNLDSY